MQSCASVRLLSSVLVLLSNFVLLCQSTLSELNGELVQCTKEVYLVTTNTTPPVKRLIPDMDVFVSWGLDTTEVKHVNCEEIHRYKVGESLPARPEPPVVVNETGVRENTEILREKLEQVVGVYKNQEHAKRSLARAVGASVNTYGNLDSNSNNGEVGGNEIHRRVLNDNERGSEELAHHHEYLQVLEKTVIVTGKLISYLQKLCSPLSFSLHFFSSIHPLSCFFANN